MQGNIANTECPRADPPVSFPRANEMRSCRRCMTTSFALAICGDNPGWNGLFSGVLSGERPVCPSNGGFADTAQAQSEALAGRAA